MIPLHDENPTRRFPLITILLIVANIGIYFLVQKGPIEFVRADPSEQLEDAKFTFENAGIPEEVTTGEPLSVREVAETAGGQAALEICEVQLQEAAPGQVILAPGEADRACFPEKNVFLSMLFSMFLHGGLLHLGGNMLFLWIFGNNIEDHMGIPRYIAFYLLGGIVAAGAHVAVQPDSAIPVVGASGAIAAVMGAYLVWFPNAPIRTIIIFFFILFREFPAKWLLAFWFVTQFFDAVNPNSGVAWMAHVGGFLFGALVALLVKTSRASA